MPGYGCRRLPARAVITANLSLLLIAILQAIYPFGRGEVIPSSFHEARSRTQLERKVAFNSYMVDSKLQAFASAPPMNVVIFNQLNSAILPFFGDDSRHHVTLVASVDALTDQVMSQVEAVALAGPKLDGHDLLSRKIAKAGFEVSVESVFFTLWRRFGQSDGMQLNQIPSP